MGYLRRLQLAALAAVTERYGTMYVNMCRVITTFVQQMSSMRNVSKCTSVLGAVGALCSGSYVHAQTQLLHAYDVAPDASLTQVGFREKDLGFKV